MEIIFSSVTGAFDDVVLDVEHCSCRKYLVPQQEGSDQSVLHTYFSRQSNEIKIRTKHFSRFRILCPTHADGGKTFEGSLRAVVYARQKEIRGKMKVDVSIALEAFSSYDIEEVLRFFYSWKDRNKKNPATRRDVSLHAVILLFEGEID